MNTGRYPAFMIVFCLSYLALYGITTDKVISVIAGLPLALVISQLIYHTGYLAGQIDVRKGKTE